MKLDKRILIGIIIVVVLILIIIIFKISFYDKEKNSKNVLNESISDEILIQVGEVYQKIRINSGVVSQASAIERGEFYSFFSGLPDKSERDFYQNLSIIESEDENRLILASYVGSEENRDKQQEFACDIVTKSCNKEKIIFADYKIDGLSLMPTSVWWLNWNIKDNSVIGLLTNDVNIGTLYVCSIESGDCKKNSAEGLNFPLGAIDKSSENIIAIRQNDIANEKIGEKWELFVYNINNLDNSTKSYDISGAISKDEDLLYDGVNSVAWARDNKSIFIGTTRGVFELKLDDERLSNIFNDVSVGEDDFYWNSDSLQLSSSGRYLVFIDNIESDVEVASDSENEEQADVEQDDGEVENMLKAIDLMDNNRVIELIQAQNITLK